MTGKKLILQLALATLIGMPLIAVLMDRFSDTIDLRTSLIGIFPWWKQIVIGVITGALFAFFAQMIIEAPFMRQVNVKYIAVLGGFRLTWNEIVFISLCAGVGEELLFRGALQPIMGILWTSLFFVAIHGYINPRDWRISVYGIYMTVVICVLGWFARSSGLVTAMIAHTLIDIWLLHKMQVAADKEEHHHVFPGNDSTHTDEGNE